MLCKKAISGDYNYLAENCYMCCVKLTTVDSPYANLYGFSEIFIRSATTTIGYRNAEDGEVYANQYETVMSGHGFSPRDVNQDLFRRSDGKIIPNKLKLTYHYRVSWRNFHVGS